MVAVVRINFPPSTLVHGAHDLPRVAVNSYNLELRDGEGFVGDRASGRAFNEILSRWRERVSEDNASPPAQGDPGSHDQLLLHGDPESAGLVQTAMEDFAHELADVTRRFLKEEAWFGVERIVVGGGLRSERVGELIIGRTAVMLKAEGSDVDFCPIHAHPDEAGLLGGVYIIDSACLAGADTLLTADIGGTNVRVGLVEHAGEAPRLMRSRLRRHADETATRDDLIEHMTAELGELVAENDASNLRLAPVIAVGCPGLIRNDGQILRGTQNLPGRWDEEGFFLPSILASRLQRACGRRFDVFLHNDAVVQGLSELPYLGEVRKWGVLTIGTGLGNARFTRK